MNTKYFFNHPESLYHDSDLLHNVFVYGTLKSGEHNHSIVSPKENGSKFLGPATTCAETYVIYCNCGFPMAQDIRVVKPNTYKIIGEIYSVNRKTLAKLDRLESNGTLYSRVKRPFIIKVNNKPTEVVAWIYLYLGNLDYYQNKNLTSFKRYVDNKKCKLIEWKR
jgi:gamma-glutamylcyclotransferase (GGCT)/AIG2-like uncharacterized protein YtfP